MMRSSNPVLSNKTFEQYDVYESTDTMTVAGTAMKTGILLVLVVTAAAYTWKMFRVDPEGLMPVMIGGAIGGLVLALITIFKKEWAIYTAPMYALAEGLFLGGISAMYNDFQNGIVFQAASLTFATMAVMLIAYSTGIIRATDRFKSGVCAATGGIFLVYMVSMVMNMFGAQMPLIHSAGPMGILFSLFVVVIAALNLVLDFDFIERGAERGAPKSLEWYGAFGLLVTLVWLYLEILRLLSKLNRR
jgi:uncharacterized YccA/Bax inhibitor family protein